MTNTPAQHEQMPDGVVVGDLPGHVEDGAQTVDQSAESQQHEPGAIQMEVELIDDHQGQPAQHQIGEQ
ncbi:hypothetical protein D3C80_958970 [compost metagenome]